MPSAPSAKSVRWGIISKRLFIGCISSTLVGLILQRLRKGTKRPKTIYQEEKKSRKLGWGGFAPDSNDVDLEAVHEFYKAVQESPLLYPYFMNVKAEKREDVMRNIACLFHKTLQKQFSPSDSVRLRDIHKNLEITEVAYNRFTKLFAHICCKGKSDELRARMLKSFATLKSEICSTTEKQPVDLASFFELLTDSKSSPSDQDSPIESKQQTNMNNLNDPITYPQKVFFPRHSAQSLVLGRAKVWNNRSTHEQLRKRIVELEDKITQLANLNHSLDARIKAMEPRSPVERRKRNFFVAPRG